MKNKAFITTIIILAFVMSVSGCSSRTPVAGTSDTAVATSIATETNEPTETATVTSVIDSTMITVPAASGTPAPANTPAASVSETTAATSVTSTSAPKETAAPTAAATTKATAATSPKPTTAKPTTAATTKTTTKATGSTAETTEQPANPNAGILDPTVPTDPPVGTYSADMAKQVFALVNQARADAGYPALTWNDTLAPACDVRAKEIVTNFGHTRPDGTSEGTASDGLSCGENIAMGRDLNTAQAAFDCWMESPSHKDNLIGVAYHYTYTAISCYCVNGVYYWVEEFGAPLG